MNCTVYNSDAHFILYAKKEGSREFCESPAWKSRWHGLAQSPDLNTLLFFFRSPILCQPYIIGGLMQQTLRTQSGKYNFCLLFSVVPIKNSICFFLLKKCSLGNYCIMLTNSILSENDVDSFFENVGWDFKWRNISYFHDFTAQRLHSVWLSQLFVSLFKSQN